MADDSVKEIVRINEEGKAYTVMTIACVSPLERDLKHTKNTPKLAELLVKTKLSKLKSPVSSLHFI